MTEMRFDMREPSFTLKIVYLAIFYIIIGSKIITKIFNKIGRGSIQRNAESLPRLVTETRMARNK